MTVRPPATAAEWDACHALCWDVLRRPWGQPRGSERDPPSTNAHHLLAEVDGRLAGTGRIHRIDACTWQVRYMAVHPELRGRGIGAAVLAGLLDHARGHGGGRVFLNAREGTAGFYQAAGFAVAGEGPLLYSSIRHLRMEREL